MVLIPSTAWISSSWPVHAFLAGKQVFRKHVKLETLLDIRQNDIKCIQETCFAWLSTFLFATLVFNAWLTVESPQIRGAGCGTSTLLASTICFYKASTQLFELCAAWFIKIVNVSQVGSYMVGQEIRDENGKASIVIRLTWHWVLFIYIYIMEIHWVFNLGRIFLSF